MKLTVTCKEMLPCGIHRTAYRASTKSDHDAVPLMASMQLTGPNRPTTTANF